MTARGAELAPRALFGPCPAVCRAGAPPGGHAADGANAGRSPAPCRRCDSLARRRFREGCFGILFRLLCREILSGTPRRLRPRPGFCGAQAPRYPARSRPQNGELRGAERKKCRQAVPFLKRERDCLPFPAGKPAQQKRRAMPASFASPCGGTVICCYSKHYSCFFFYILVVS